MVQPLAWLPVTVHGVGVPRAGGVPQVLITLPLTEPPALALWSRMLPFDQMSPVTKVFEFPWKVIDAPAPLQVPGLRVRIAAPLVPALRATAVAAAPTVTVGPE